MNGPCTAGQPRTTRWAKLSVRSWQDEDKHVRQAERQHPGYGATSVVRMATFKPLKQVVAVKVMEFEGKSSITMMQREVQLMSVSKHPNVRVWYMLLAVLAKVRICRYCASGETGFPGLISALLAVSYHLALLWTSVYYTLHHLENELSASVSDS